MKEARNSLFDLCKNLGSSQRKILSIFFTAGYPSLGDTTEILFALQEAGVELVELGFPFSDSLVDGPTIQAANEQALANGMTLDLYFRQVRAARNQGLKMALVAMTCFNPVLQYGVENFAQSCCEAGIDGVIIPDLPVAVYQSDYQDLFNRYNLPVIFLVTSHTATEKIRLIDQLSRAFIYVVSSDAVTGGALSQNAARESYLRRLAGMQLQSPLLVGFGISDAAAFRAVRTSSSGAVVGSAFLRHLARSGVEKQEICTFVRSFS